MDTGIELASRHFGNRAKLAQALGIARQAVYKWQEIPPERCLEIERLTDGALVREDLRPDLFRRDAA